MKALTMKNPSCVWTGETGRASRQSIWAEGDGRMALGQVLGTAAGCAVLGMVVYAVLALLDLVQSWAIAHAGAGVGF